MPDGSSYEAVLEEIRASFLSTHQVVKAILSACVEQHPVLVIFLTHITAQKQSWNSSKGYPFCL